MGKVVLDAATKAKLYGLKHELELYDEQGNLLGYCTPADPGLSELPVQSDQKPFSEDEIEEAMKDTDTGRPLADILADLRRQ
jgi:hypothetical protein